MTFSKWSAHGNVYLLVEAERLTPERARELSSAYETDGALEVLDVHGAEAEIAVWNPDGSRAELSGNGTRIAARWLAEREGADEVRIRVGDRVTKARIVGDLVEQELGPVEVGASEEVDGIEFVPVSVGNPHAVVQGEPAAIALPTAIGNAVANAIGVRDRKSTRLNSSHVTTSRMPSSA